MATANSEVMWNVWFACTGGLYAILRSEDLSKALTEGVHEITQIARSTLTPPPVAPTGPLGKVCTCTPTRM